ncbi:MAG: iron-sulfur cluster assembly scaffold protein [Fibrobacter sp.]|nr:iron-sulfur cluster assembly scaffold protein [Fibrobacter sp.]
MIWITAGTAVLIIAIGILAVYSWITSQISDPDGYARITGPCGDTMEVSFTVKEKVIDSIRSVSSGCSISKMCAHYAGSLAKGRSIDEAREINRESIMNNTGKLPETHLHCAVLAETTLQAALDMYEKANLKK